MRTTPVSISRCGVRALRFGLAAVLIVGCTTRPGDGSSGPQPDRQVLRSLTVNMARSLDPVHIDAQRITSDGLAEPLVMLNDDATLEPWLAKSWSHVAPDTWQFDLQPGVRFWSGAPVDAAAVKAALERHQTKNIRAASILKGWQFIVRDPVTLIVKTPTDDPGVPFRIAAYPIHNAATAEQMGDTFGAAPDLTGWFKPVQFVPGELLIAEANETYWRGKPKLQRLEDRIATDAQLRLLALRSGEADAEYNVEIDQRLDYEKDPGRFQVYAPAPSTRTIWMNIRKQPALQDLRVRRALSLAVDREELITGLNHGFARPATGHFPTGLPYALETGDAFDPGLARRLLDEAGWQPGPDGVRSKNGRPLRFRILTYVPFQGLAVALQSYWKRVGVATELTPVETTASNQLMYDGNFELATYCSCGAATGDLAGQLRSFYRSGVVTNFGRYSNPAVDVLIDELAGEFDRARQIELAKRIQTTVRDDVAVIYLYSSTQWSTVYSARVKGVNPNQARNVLPSIWIGN